MSIQYFDRQGKKISLEEWADAVEDRIVARDIVGKYMVSTVWLGLDHNWLGNQPMIFETIIFYLPDGEDGGWKTVMEPVRYSTEEQALLGHQYYLQGVRDGEYTSSPT